MTFWEALSAIAKEINNCDLFNSCCRKKGNHQQNKTQNLELNFTEKGIKVYNGELLTFESQTQTKNDIANMMAVLVKLCPKTLTINYHNNNSHIETIKRIFSEKVI